MNKLSLDAFKAKMSQEDITKTDALIGGILGACHPIPLTTPEAGLAKSLKELADRFK